MILKKNQNGQFNKASKLLILKAILKIVKKYPREYIQEHASSFPYLCYKYTEVISISDQSGSMHRAFPEFDKAIYGMCINGFIRPVGVNSHDYTEALEKREKFMVEFIEEFQ